MEVLDVMCSHGQLSRRKCGKVVSLVIIVLKTKVLWFRCIVAMVGEKKVHILMES